MEKSYDADNNYIEDTMLSIRCLASSTHHTMGGLVADNDHTGCRQPAPPWSVDNRLLAVASFYRE